MNIHILKDISEVSEAASTLISNVIKANPSVLMCTASGGTPTKTYEKLVGKLSSEERKSLRIIKLDEWGGISMSHPQTCEQYIQKYILRPLGISPENYIRFESNPENPESEAKRVQAELDKSGGIDICVLGLGANGHIAFNEPAEFLQPNCHIAELSEKSMVHPMALEMTKKPTYGITLGMADILRSKKIVMLISGAGKGEIIRHLLERKITGQLPASFLWLHSNAECFIDETAISV